MIRELSELGKRLRLVNQDEKEIHNALKEEIITIDLIIDNEGNYKDFILHDKIKTSSEALAAKKGRARLLVDKAEEVLFYGGEKSQKKHQLFLEKLNLYSDLIELKPVIKFYEINKTNGFDKALIDFEVKITEKDRGGNIAFKVLDHNIRVHEEKNIINKIIENYENIEKVKLSKSLKKCSICGKSDYPVENAPHGMIKRVPSGQTSGCALISFNFNATESYNLSGNLNSSICTNCAKTYVEGLNYLMTNGRIIINLETKGKKKEYFQFTNRKNFGSDTAMVFWTRDNAKLKEIDLFEEPNEDDICKLIDSISNVKTGSIGNVNSDVFYSFTLSGAAARIFVRDWIESSLEDIRRNIKTWFEDILIMQYDSTQKKMVKYYSSLYKLAFCCQNNKDKDKFVFSRTANLLWNSALKENSLPITILNNVLKRVKLDGVTPERATLIKLILNRNNTGGIKLMEKLDESNKSIAYISGRIFAVLESIQYAALGKTNAGLRERFFSSASTTPSTAFGRIIKMSQHHLSKLKGEKPGLAVIFDKELSQLCSLITSFPTTFSLEEQGQFAIGFYHQKQTQFNKKELTNILMEE